MNDNSGGTGISRMKARKLKKKTPFQGKNLKKDI
jgi:hypothetical protein